MQSLPSCVLYSFLENTRVFYDHFSTKNSTFWREKKSWKLWKIQRYHVLCVSFPRSTWRTWRVHHPSISRPCQRTTSLVWRHCRDTYRMAPRRENSKNTATKDEGWEREWLTFDNQGGSHKSFPQRWKQTDSSWGGHQRGYREGQAGIVRSS